MYVISGCPRSGTSLMMDIFRESLGTERILGHQFPAEEPQDEQVVNTPIRRYQQHLRTLQEPRDHARIRDMNPEGFWECPFTVQGLAYRPNVGTLLKQVGAEAEPSACKVVSQGLARSNPVYIDDVVYMLRKPDAVMKSQERLQRTLLVRAPETGVPLDVLGGLVIQSPQMFIQVTLQAAQWLEANPEVPLHIVRFEDLIRTPMRVLRRLGKELQEDLVPGATRIRKDLDRSSKAEVSHPFLDEANQVYQWFLRRQWGRLRAYREDRSTQFNRTHQQWVCARSQSMAQESTCRACMRDVDFAKQLRQHAERQGIAWQDQPCAFECAFDVDRTRYKSLESSIKYNHWRKAG